MRLAFSVAHDLLESARIFRIRIPRDDAQQIFDEIGREAVLVRRETASLDVETGTIISFDANFGDLSHVDVRLERGKRLRLTAAPATEIMPEGQLWDFLSEDAIDFIGSAMQMAGFEEDLQPGLLGEVPVYAEIEAQVLARSGGNCELTGADGDGLSFIGPVIAAPLRPIDEGGVLDPRNFLAVSKTIEPVLRLGGLTFTADGEFIVRKALIDPEVEVILNPSGRLSPPAPGFVGPSSANLGWHRNHVLDRTRGRR